MFYLFYSFHFTKIKEIGHYFQHSYTFLMLYNQLLIEKRFKDVIILFHKLLPIYDEIYAKLLKKKASLDNIDSLQKIPINHWGLIMEALLSWVNIK